MNKPTWRPGFSLGPGRRYVFEYDSATIVGPRGIRVFMSPNGAACYVAGPFNNELEPLPKNWTI